MTHRFYKKWEGKSKKSEPVTDHEFKAPAVEVGDNPNCIECGRPLTEHVDVP